MPGRNGSDNKFGPGPFIVGTVLGDGCNYDKIQSAINDCFAAGGGTVFIRVGNYTENLTIRETVDLYGFDVDGRLPSTLSHVVVTGNHTFTGTPAGFNISIFQNITFSCLAGDLFTLTQAGGGGVICAAKFCGFEAFTDPASRGFVLNADGTSSCQFSTDNCNINSASHTFEAIGAGSTAASLNLGSCNSASGNSFQLTAGSGTLQLMNGQISANTYLFNGLTPNGQCQFSHSDLFCGQEAVIFPAGNGQMSIRHVTLSSGAASTNFVDGTGGQLDYCDVALTGSATGIGASITQIFSDWKPYGATTHVGVNRYNPAEFSVSASTGEVSLLAPSSFTWNDIAAPTVISDNTGSFMTAPVTVQLPAAPVQGSVTKFKVVTGGSPVVIQTNVGQTFQIANQTGTNATSTLVGDAIEFTYYAAGTTWVANSIIGNWNVT